MVCASLGAAAAAWVDTNLSTATAGVTRILPHTFCGLSCHRDLLLSMTAIQRDIAIVTAHLVVCTGLNVCESFCFAWPAAP
jgi:hypothetical protein